MQVRPVGYKQLELSVPLEAVTLEATTQVRLTNYCNNFAKHVHNSAYIPHTQIGHGANNGRGMGHGKGRLPLKRRHSVANGSRV